MGCEESGRRVKETKATPAAEALGTMLKTPRRHTGGASPDSRNSRHS
jgi:hypothetical protein